MPVGIRYLLVLQRELGSMVDSIEKAKEVYRRDGVFSLVSKGMSHLLVPITSLPILDSIAYFLSVRRLSRRMEAENDLEDILTTAFHFRGYGRYRTLQPLQIRSEFRELVEQVDIEQPTIVMEIGTANGGSLYTWCRSLDSTSTVISLDLPKGKYGGGYTRKKTRFFEEFASNKELHFIRADSHEEATVKEIERILAGRKIDFLMIDGDHRYKGVKQDFEMYSPFVKEGGLIAFHDVVDGPKSNVGGVPEFWCELKSEYETREIIADEFNQEGYGIGILKK